MLKKTTHLDESNPFVPYLFLLPHALFFLAFIIYPVGYGIWISLHRYDPLSATQPFVGLEYFRNVFSPTTLQSRFFWKTILNTLFFVAVSTPLLVGYSLALAVQLNRPVFGRSFFRSVFFMPGILSVAVVGLLWRWMFEDRVGLVNSAVSQVFNLTSIPFLTTEWLAWVPIVIATVWWTVGFNMIIYLAALTTIPAPFYEAAELDGANSWVKFRHITLPLLRPTTLFVFVTTVLTSFQVFGQPLLITAGGPTRSTQSVMMYITEEGFDNFQLSSATAMSLVFGAVMLVFTVLQFRLMARDVSRGGP